MQGIVRLWGSLLYRLSIRVKGRAKEKKIKSRIPERGEGDISRSKRKKRAVAASAKGMSIKILWWQVRQRPRR